MKVLALSYLFPNHAQLDYGVFVLNRLMAVQKLCEVKVIAPLQSYPFRNFLRPKLAINRAIGSTENMGGLETWYPRFSVIPRYLKFYDAFSYYAAVKPVVSKMMQDGFTFDVIDAHWTYPDILAAYFLSQQYRKPFIVTVRGKEALYIGEHGGRKIILDWCLRRANAIITLSSELANLVAEIGVSRHKIQVVLNGVDDIKFHQIDRFEARLKLGLAQQKKLIISVGRLTEAKGHQHIIRSLSLLTNQTDVELHIIGGLNPETDYSTKLKAQVAALGLGNVFFHNGIQHEHLFYWYNAADLFCLATKGEGCPNVVLESLACGTPVVVTDVGAVSDMLSNGSDGYIINNLDQLPIRIADALEVVWDRERIAFKAQSRNWSVCAEEVIAVYKKVIAVYNQSVGSDIF